MKTDYLIRLAMENELPVVVNDSTYLDEWLAGLAVRYSCSSVKES